MDVLPGRLTLLDVERDGTEVSIRRVLLQNAASRSRYGDLVRDGLAQSPETEQIFALSVRTLVLKDHEKMVRTTNRFQSPNGTSEALSSSSSTSGTETSTASSPASAPASPPTVPEEEGAPETVAEASLVAHKLASTSSGTYFCKIYDKDSLYDNGEWFMVQAVRIGDAPATGLYVVLQTDITHIVRYEHTLSSIANLLIKMLPEHLIHAMLPKDTLPLSELRQGITMPNMSARRTRVAGARVAGAHTRGVTAMMDMTARSHNDVTVVFLDVVGFTSMSEAVEASEVMMFLNTLFAGLDGLLEAHGVQKIETAGDCYIVAAGVLASAPHHAARRTPAHLISSGQVVVSAHDPSQSAHNALSFAKAALALAARVPSPSPLSFQKTQVRIGIHTGQCVSGLIGRRLPKFGVFGDTMNVASRMESTAPPGAIQVSAATYALLGATERFEPTGGINIKGKGLMDTYVWPAGAGHASAVSGRKSLTS